MLKFVFVFAVASLVLCPKVSAKMNARPNVYCGFSELTDFPKLDKTIRNINLDGYQLVYTTTKGDQVHVLVTLTDSIYDQYKKDLSLLVLNSTGGGFYHTISTGILASENKSSGAHLQLPLPRKDGGIYFVKIMCAI